MIYADKDYYQNVYKGTMLPDDDQMDVAVLRASEMIDNLTGLKLKSGPYKFESLHPMLQEQVKKATCGMIEAIVIAGGYEYYVDHDMLNVEIGNFSYGAGSANVGSNAERFPAQVLETLATIGLLYQAIDMN